MQRQASNLRVPKALEHRYRAYFKRWFDLPAAALNHPVQQRLISSTAQFRVVAAGRRSYKTERAKRMLVIGDLHHPGALTLPGGRFFYAAPTFSQAKRIAWEDLKSMTRPYQSGRPLDSELCIRLQGGGELWVVGMDRPERIEGTMWHGMVLDEYGNFREEAWPNNIQPLTSDTGAWVVMTGVPEGRNHFYDRFQYARTAGDPDWEAFHWKSSDVLDPKVIQRAMRDLDERAFRQEYEASFELVAGVVYYTFDDQSIVDYPFVPSAPSVLSWDFNAGIKPMAVTMIQQVPMDYRGRKNTPKLVQTKEWVYSQTNTETMCDAIVEELEREEYNGPLEICGDHWGVHVQSAAARRDFDIIQAKFAKWTGGEYPLSRPTRKVKNRTDALCSMFRTIDGHRHLFVSRACRKTIYDLENVQWKDNRMQLDDSDPQRTHPSDALSYFAFNYFRAHERFTDGVYKTISATR
jgi:hypothetical protein